MPAHKDKLVSKIVLENKDGVIKQTCADLDHYSWWRTREFNLNHCELL